ncbi:MAG: UDP-N-acetylglucosamine 1-carboxyvinyltransferase [Candidatus Paraimprobicoccus trichonymphae]|uniref:UDP-N-acetylglucosamine 1-carboxyvinyltransferase n=1 Tax=Candidatus Paraimprobicoccus trichonymphae TaxID=3033793 RepID=A0AA48ICD2_9FIRM|nr:MAG: UDP-N-acetylglucosamine 1-carboxyvinyltransferase [Candidatus Paraimprobicoccus trichonymphae]
MSKLLINGEKKLIGEVKIQGSKNSALPILAACIMSEDICVLKNCPSLLDIYVSIEILEHLGCKVKFEDSVLTVDSRNVHKHDVPEKLMRKMRSSIIFLGALVSRVGKAKLSFPGGCALGARPIDLHLDNLKHMGIEIYENHGFISCKVNKKLTDCKITLSFPSVGATENLILAAVKSEGIVQIINPAREPEIFDLINFLNKCGAKIKISEENNIIIHGIKKLHGTEHGIIPDRIVATTYMSAVAITGGSVLIKNINHKDLDSIISVFTESGCSVIIENNNLYLKAPRKLNSNKSLRTMPYPGFPTDAQAIIMAMNTVSDGTSIFIENIFENRYKHVSELARLGADIKIEGKVAIVKGVKKLSGANVKSTDLRGAASLAVAGLNAEGQTIISDIYHLDRGYENFEQNLRNLGANISRLHLKILSQNK